MSTTSSDPRVTRGMEAQMELRQSRLDGGDTPLGWKVGFGSPAARENLSIANPLVAFLNESARLPSGASVSIGDWTKAILEPEIAVYVGKDLAADADRDTVQAAIASLGPAIELVDLSFPPEDVEAILAKGIYNRHVILGQADTSRAGCVLDGLAARVTSGGEEVSATTDPQAMIGDMLDVVRYVADLLAAHGEMLRAGEVIITGAIMPPIPLSGGEEISYTLDPVDSVSCSFSA